MPQAPPLPKPLTPGPPTHGHAESNFLSVRLLLAGMACVALSICAVGCAQVSQTVLDEVQSAAARVVPREARVEVTGEATLFAKPRIVISAHLLEGYSADSNDPYVRGDYATHEKLTRLVKLRCARIYSSVFKGGIDLKEASSVVIRVRHGVRMHYGSYSGPSSDVALTIFQVSLSIDKAKEIDLEAARTSEIESMWRAEANIISQLEFRAVSL